MNETRTTDQPEQAPTTTVYYGKMFAFIGVICGFIMLFGTPGIVTLFHASDSSWGREWVESLPDWTAPTMLCIGMGGGVLAILLSASFGMLIPSRVVREGAAPDSKKQAAV